MKSMDDKTDLITCCTWCPITPPALPQDCVEVRVSIELEGLVVSLTFYKFHSL